MKLWVKKYPQEGDLRHTYSALKNKVNPDNSLVDFNTDELSINLNNPLNIECQPSYDGTVNLIINDDTNPPRIINSRFTKIEDNRFRIINRNQKEQTNLYKEGQIDLQTRLFRNVSKIPKLCFVEQNYFGQLKGGNYTFYIKFADSDFNKTDVVCESGQVSVFKGNLFDIASISGTLQDERTDKSIKFKLINIDQSFSKFYVYYTREFSDTNGFRMTETKMLTEPYDIKGSSQELIINGFEVEEMVATTELNIQYNYVDNVKTQAQVQNMLFFGNIENTVVDYKNLQNLSLFFNVKLSQRKESIGWIKPENYYPENNDFTKLEYYDPQNIYYNLGYWPDEMYRLGVVYIMKDDSLSPVFNLRGCVFDKENRSNKREDVKYKIRNKENDNYVTNYLERNAFLTGNGFINYDNSYGVFKNPNESELGEPIFGNKVVRPWYYEISIPNWTNEEWNVDNISFTDELKRYGVKGYFFVRQKRIPTTICQGYSVGIDKSSSTPMLYDGAKYFSESFLSSNCQLTDTFGSRIIESTNKLGNALISVDANIHPVIQSDLDGSKFVLERVNDCVSLKQNKRNFIVELGQNTSTYVSHPCIFVGSDIPYKYVNEYGFSTRAGTPNSVKEFGFFGKDLLDYRNDDERVSNKKVRGVYSPIIGVCGSIRDNAIYNVKIQNYSTNHLLDYIKIRANDNSAFYAISDRYGLDEMINSIDVYRGDCYTNTVTVRLNRNFTDPDYPISDTIINSDTWSEHYGGYLTTNTNDKDSDENYNWAKINRGDVNSVPLGMWVTYKCLSSYNLGIRSEDRSYVDETALLGNPRSFHPLNGMSTKSANKQEESWILNDGYSATVGQKINIAAPNLPYVKDQFDNRIMFSNVQVDGDFRNAYRIFQGLSYKDIDRQYGAIVKLIPWGVNLLCVFEHGLAVVPINEKALIQTGTEQSVHMYGAGVLQNQVSLITPDFGSIWPESIVRTPIGVYGVDTHAKKIWRYTDKKGFETISDMKIQRFLNDNIILKEKDKYPIIGLKNVKTHYNNHKGDVMFTFYNFTEGKEWHLCFNERLDEWVTKYSWTPLYSENINNVFYSLDKRRAEILSYIYHNKHNNYGVITDNNEWLYDKETESLSDTFTTKLTLQNIDLATDFDIEIKEVRSSYIKNGVEIPINIDLDKIHWDINNKTISWNKSDLEYVYGVRIPLYYKIEILVKPEYDEYGLLPFNDTICVVVDYRYDEEAYSELLGNCFYVHGRAGIFDEISYTDDDTENQIKPTKWYNKQEPFEFEFVVNEPVGLHKIFDNLVIISNKVEPKSIEIDIIGEVYNFKKSGLFKSGKGFKNTKVNYDPILNQYTLTTEQESKNIENPEYGRRLGNIHYKEDSWYLTIEPIKFDPEFKADDQNPPRKWNSTRIRDKFARIRVKYSGEDLAIITSLKTLYTLSSS